MSLANVKRRSRGRSQKLNAMEECGIKVTRNPAEMGKLLKSVLR
jgi:succinyl-CoA synthetase alpha subunit